MLGSSYPSASGSKAISVDVDGVQLILSKDVLFETATSAPPDREGGGASLRVGDA